MFPIGSETIKRRKIKFPIVIKKSVEMVIGVLVSEKNFDLLNEKPLKFRPKNTKESKREDTNRLEH